MLKKILPGTRGGSASVSHPRYICRALQRGDTVELTCASLAAGGDGVCKTDDGLVVFVPRALPGERLVARMVNVKRKYASGELLRTVTPSADAVSPPCKYFSRCGGCTWQSLSYDAQLFAKESSVKEALRRIGRVTRQGALRVWYSRVAQPMAPTTS